MDETMKSNLEVFLGKIDLGDPVLYVRNSDPDSLGNYKKDIWVVESIDNNNATIKNYSKAGTEFTTSITNLIALKSIRSLGLEHELKSWISTPSWKLLQNNYAVYDDKKPVAGIKYINTLNTESRESRNIGEITMMNKLINDNVSAAKNGAVLSAGNTLNKVVKDAVRGQVPRKYRKLMDIPGADIVVANVANVAIQNFAKTNRKAQVATSAMMEAAMFNFMNSFNLDKIISDTLKNVNLDDLIDNTV